MKEINKERKEKKRDLEKRHVRSRLCEKQGPGYVLWDRSDKGVCVREKLTH